VIIKNCPYCFSDQVYIMQNDNSYLWQVQCLKCLRHGRGAESKDLAVEFWNEDINKAKGTYWL